MAPGRELEAPAGLRLPPDFDGARDVLVWVGPAGPGLPRGARVFLVDEAAEACPSGVTRVRSAGELFQAVLVLAGPAPAHVLVHRRPGVEPARARALAESLKKALGARAMAQKTVAEAGPTWLRQGLANLPALAAQPTILPLRGAFAGKPCVLVSPGPSLTRNVEQLRALSARALIVSGTHALSALAAAGVTPHLVLCADPGDLSRHWEGLDTQAVEAFVIGATCRPETFAVPARRRFVFASNGTSDDWLFAPLGATPTLPTGGSVACSMLSFALHLGCDPIAFVGQDLAFERTFYAAGGLDGDAEVQPAERPDEFVLVKPAGSRGIGAPLADGRLQFTVPQRILEVPGWAGGMVRTTPQLQAFRDWFEAVVPALAGRARILNCTEGGARIEGLEHLPLRAASAAWAAPLAVAAPLDAACAGLDARAQRRALGAWARSTLAALETCIEFARRCRALSTGTDGAALTRAEKKLSQALRAAPLVALVAQAEITAARERARTARTLAENLAAARTLYGLVEQAGALLLAPLRESARALA